VRQDARRSGGNERWCLIRANSGPLSAADIRTYVGFPYLEPVKTSNRALPPWFSCDLFEEAAVRPELVPADGCYLLNFMQAPFQTMWVTERFPHSPKRFSAS
jgi:hypothetical protein